MGRRESGRQAHIKIVAIGLMSLAAVCGILAVFFYFRTMYYTSDEVRALDLARVNGEKPECLMLSMLPPEAFNEEDFSYFRGMRTVKADHRFENLYDIEDFFGEAEADPSVVFLAVDPVSISSRYGFHASLYGRAYRDTLLSEVRENGDTSYEMLLSYYPLGYWKTLSEKGWEDAVASYRDFVNVFGGEPNVKLFFFGAEEWLIANPGNYGAENSCNEAVTRLIAAFAIRDDTYRLTADNMEERFSAIRAVAEGGSMDPLLAGEDLSENADLREMDIVFFGDSVIGNFTDSASIPGVVSGLSGARTYNLGVGGTTATFRGAKGELSLHTMVDLFLGGDASRLDDGLPVKRVIEEYALEHADGESRGTCFILNFGLNDYFTGMPIDLREAGDERASYAGALRSAVKRLREAYPDSRVILMAPNYSAEFQGGTQIRSPEGGTLADYAGAVLEVADETGAEVIDNYNGLGIGADNVWRYISDGTHPNELGRYVIGRRIVQHLSQG